MSYRKRTIRKYTKRAPMSVPRPFGKYNEDFYASIQVNGSMVAQLAAQTQLQFRDDGTGTTAFLIYLGDVPEFTAKALNYSSYTIVSTSLVWTSNPLVASQVVIAAGNGAFVPTDVVNSPLTQARLVGLPIQSRAKVDGSTTRVYYACEADRRASGFPTGQVTNFPYPLGNSCATALISSWIAPTAVNNVLGGYQFTWYVRFHGTRYGP